MIDTAANGDPLLVRGTAEVVETGGDDFTYTMARRYEGRRRGDSEAERLIDLARSLGQPQGDYTDHAAAGPDRRLRARKVARALRYAPLKQRRYSG